MEDFVSSKKIVQRNFLNSIVFFLFIFSISLGFSVHGSAKVVQKSSKGKVRYVNFEEEMVSGKGSTPYYSHVSSKDKPQIERLSSWKLDWVRKMKESRASLR